MPVADHGCGAHPTRRQRDLARVRRAGAAARIGGKSATEVALVEIRAAFDAAAAINSFKIKVEQLTLLSTGHPAVRARFSGRAEMLAGRDLDAAIVAVERWWRDECKAFAIACAFGGGTRLSLEILRELRLILRLLRRKRMRMEYQAIRAAICDLPGTPVAAE